MNNFKYRKWIFDHYLLKVLYNEFPQLAKLLQDAVASGASIGFLPPLTDKEAINYWHGGAEALKTSHRILLAVELEQQIIGTVQVALESRPNGSHRAEVMKLMVYTSMRGKGIAQARWKQSKVKQNGRKEAHWSPIPGKAILRNIYTPGWVTHEREQFLNMPAAQLCSCTKY